MDEKQTPTSYIQFIFKEADSVLFQLSMSGVSALQMVSASEYLRVLAEGMIRADMQREAEQASMRKIAVPGSQVEGILHR